MVINPDYLCDVSLIKALNLSWSPSLHFPPSLLCHVFNIAAVLQVQVATGLLLGCKSSCCWVASPVATGLQVQLPLGCKSKLLLGCKSSLSLGCKSSLPLGCKSSLPLGCKSPYCYLGEGVGSRWLKATSPLQELEVGAHRAPYLLVHHILFDICYCWFCL